MADSTETKQQAFAVPTKRILSKAHLAAFARSKAHAELLAFIDDLNERIVGIKLSEIGQPSEVGSNASRYSASWRLRNQLSHYLHASAP